MKQTTIINTQQLFIALDEVWAELLNLLNPVNEMIFNVVPFKDSWTIAQVATHIKKSNKAIVQSLQMKGEPCNRNAENEIEKLKTIFLDFSAKYNSPGFIIPENKEYQKEAVIEQLENSIEQLKQLRIKTNFFEILTLPALGEITKLEMLYFVLYHTQRHVHQLGNIIKIISNKN